jgi:hypothetical protein
VFGLSLTLEVVAPCLAHGAPLMEFERGVAAGDLNERKVALKEAKRMRERALRARGGDGGDGGDGGVQRCAPRVHHEPRQGKGSS